MTEESSEKPQTGPKDTGQEQRMHPKETRPSKKERTKTDDKATNKQEKLIDYEDIEATPPEKEFLQPKPGDSEELKVQKLILAETLLQRKQLMQTLGGIHETLISHNTALAQLIQIFNATGDPDTARAIGERIDKMEENMSAESKQFDGVLEKIYQSYNAQNRLILKSSQATQMFMAQLEASQNIPENLKNPTLDRMALRLSIEDRDKYSVKTEIVNGKEVVASYDEKKWNAENKTYQTAVKDWLTEHVRRMESNDLAFEEQPDVYRYLTLYVSNFALTKGTREFGEKLTNMLEKRRILHRTKRVEFFSPPDGVVAELGKINVSTLSDFFRTEIVGSYAYDKDGNKIEVKKTVDGKEVVEYKTENHIEKELRNYERMMRITRLKRDQYRDEYLLAEEKMKLSKKIKKLSLKDKREIEEREEFRALKREISQKEKYIIDYYRSGGSVEDKGIENAYVGADKWNEELGDQSNDNKENFFYRLGTVKKNSNGDVVYQVDGNGNIKKDNDGKPLPEVHTYRKKDLVQKHIKENDQKEQMYRDTVWARKYAGGLSSVMFRVSREAQLNGTTDFYAQRILNFGEKLDDNYLMRISKEIHNPTQGSFKGQRLSLEYHDLMSSILEKAKQSDLEQVGIKNKKLKDLNGSFLSFENLEWGSEKLWDELVNEKLNTKEGTPAIRATYFKESDDGGRKFMWGPDSYTHTPSLEASAKIEGIFSYMGTAPYEDEDGNLGYVIRGTGKRVIVSQQEAKRIDLFDRSLEWLKTDEAEELIGNPLTGFARTAEIRKWIRSWTKNGIIDSSTRDAFYEKHLGTSNRFLLDRMTEISVLWNDTKANWGAMTLEGFTEYLKRAFGYIFGDELRG